MPHPTKSIRHRCAVVGAALLLLALFMALPDSPVEGLERTLFDELVTFAPPVAEDHRIVIVDIDEASLARVGHWPWPRATVAKLVDKLVRDYHAAIVGLDVVFPEAKPGDEALRQAASAPNVIMSQVLDFNAESTNRAGRLADPVADALQASSAGAIPRAAGYIGNAPSVLPASPRVGHISPLVDSDGLVRRVYPLACYQQTCALSLSLRMYAALVDTGPASARLEGGTLTLSSFGDAPLALPLDADKALMVPWQVMRGGFRHVSAADVLASGMELSGLDGAVVIIGSTALGLGDRVATPQGNVVPGVEVHAQLFSSLLDEAFVTPMPANSPLFLALLAMVVFSYPFWPARTVRSKLVWPVVNMTVVVVALAVAFRDGSWLPLAPLPALIVLVTVLGMLADALFLDSRIQGIGKQFGRFLPTLVVDRVMQDSEVKAESELHTMSVLIVDVRGFTRASEGKAPEQVAEFAQKCFEALCAEVERYHGTIEKYTGDGLMALWGVPTAGAHAGREAAPLLVVPASAAVHPGVDLAHAPYAAQAVSAAVAMHAAIERLRPWFVDKGYPDTALSIGVNTGPMSVGVFGGKAHLAWSAQGQAFNIGSRIEQLTRTIKEPILLGESTAQLLDPRAVRSVGSWPVKGLDEPIQVFGLARAIIGDNSNNQ